MTERKARKLTKCPACKNDKNIGLVVCWTCFKDNRGGKITPLKYFGGSVVGVVIIL